MRTTTALALASLLISAAAAAPTQGDSEVTEIRLGQAPPAHAKADPSLVHAVERFLAARQDASIDRTLAGHARALLATHEKVDDEVLFGPHDASMAAFDFHDDGIETLGSGRFRVTAYLLFSDDEGKIVQSRDENLVFTAREGGTACTELHTTNVISWNQDGIAETAKTIGASLELERANRYLREGARSGDRLLAYSLADVTRDSGGKVLVQCLRFRSQAGKRGFEVTASPLVLTRTADSIRVEPN